MHPNSVGVVATSCEGQMDPGGLMKRIFGLRANEAIYIGRWIRLATRSISCSLQRGMRVLPSGSSESVTLSKQSAPTSCQRRRESGLSKGHRGAQTSSRTRPALPLSTSSLSQQCGGARSPDHQTPGQSHAGLPCLSLGVANDSGY